MKTKVKDPYVPAPFLPDVIKESMREVHELRGEPIPPDLFNPEDDAYVDAVESERERIKEYDVIVWYTESDTIRVKGRDEFEAFEEAKKEFRGEVDDYEVNEVAK